MFHPSSIHPDVAMRDLLMGNISVVNSAGKSSILNVYGDWEKPTNDLPDDFVICAINGEPGGVGMDTPFARGFLMVTLYNKLKDNGAIKKERIEKILEQFDTLIEKSLAGDYHFEYDHERFITPTTPNMTSGYSVTTLNLKWTTTSNFNK